jgi:hypothetical protein
MPLVSEATMIMSLEGHLFDSGLINQTLMSWKRINAVLEQCAPSSVKVLDKWSIEIIGAVANHK